MSKKNGNREIRKPKKIREKEVEISAVSQQSVRTGQRVPKK
jgi:hypothetical protein